MSSNTPPAITPNTNTDADFTPDDNHSPTANVVTQASELTQEFDLVSTPAAQRNRNTLSDEFMDYQDHEHILEHANTETTPIMEPSTVVYYPTPTNASPDTSKKRIHSMMESTTMQNIDRAAAARSMVTLSNSAGKKRYTPKTSLLTFLREDTIGNHASLLEAKGKPTINTTGTLRLAKRTWFNDAIIKTKDDKFKKFREKMDILCETGLLSPPLTTFHNRLLLEDVMGIEKEQELVLLIHQSHRYVAGKSETWWSRRIQTIGNNHVPDRVNYIVFQSNLYWALRIVVVSNPERESLYDKVHTQNDIVRGCTQAGGWGLRVQVGTGEQQNILFHDLLVAPTQLQVWAKGKHTSYSSLNAKLRRLSGINLSATTKRLMDESYGDSILCHDLCHRYTTMMTKLADNVKANVVKTAIISSQKIKDHYSLPSNHPPFVLFRDEVNKICEEAILSTYGTFNTITDPILTYTQVRITKTNIILLIYNLI